ncbi:MAG: hypothetical protein F6K54_35935 [Okeania sp. SIO3B5]|uniref:hypothetical protein n=1 Tax=Okeania sp. SIO3B5 TaxID=2607811 RepID=UPI0014008B69|nr:hypothetical protein [Okeania sp. SIO3B5]NEO57979.1 hypothetical protein [Okeania sp. SIO3B5]
MLLYFISLNLIALLPNIIALTTLPEYSDSYITFSPSKATTLTFAFIDTPEIEKLLLSPQEEEDPDEEPGNTLPPN